MPNDTESKSNPLDTQVGGDHYKKLAIQPIEYCQRNKLGYCESSVIKYLTRHRDKNGLQDLRKAQHCLELLIELEYGGSKEEGKRCGTNESTAKTVEMHR